MVIFLVSRRKKMKLSLLSPLEKFLWLAVEKSADASPCLRAEVRPLLTSRTVSKVSGTKDDDFYFLNPL